MRRCLIITGGTIDLDFAGSFLEHERFDKVIAVDAGLERAAALGLTPDMIVGDFDTVKPEVLEKFRQMEHIVWDVHQPEKDETDTELALRKAQAIGSDEIAGFGDIDRTGYLDRLYVGRDFQGRGIATAICGRLEEHFPVERVTVCASITARPFFEGRGYRVLQAQKVLRRGVYLTNFVMEKRFGESG